VGSSAVFVADLSRVQRKENAQVALAGTRAVLSATPVPWPQPTEPGRQNVDLFYEIAIGRNDLRPGQAVVVSLPLGDTVSRVTVAQSALLWDNAGDPSVYVREDAVHFRRRKLLLGSPLADRIVVIDGLIEGDMVVVVGAESLYGEEYRWQIPQEDEDD